MTNRLQTEGRLDGNLIISEAMLTDNDGGWLRSCGAQESWRMMVKVFSC